MKYSTRFEKAGLSVYFDIIFFTIVMINLKILKIISLDRKKKKNHGINKPERLSISKS